MSPQSNLIFYVLAIFLMLSGCASAPQHLSQQTSNEIKNVAVISLVPESVNFDKIGMISFASRHTEFGMGSKVTDSILSVSNDRIAKSHPKWVVKSIEYDPAALLAKLSPQLGYGGTQTKEAFVNLARNNNLDAIFVVRASAETENTIQQQFADQNLREGLNVVLKSNSLDGHLALLIRANLDVAIINRNGEVMAVGSVPTKLDTAEELKPDDYDVNEDMTHNHRPNVLTRLERPVIADLKRRLGLCFDSLGFVDKSPETQDIDVAPPSNASLEPTEKSPAQPAPATDAFDQCFSRCRQYTDRTKEQCFDVCNK
jgi:hypothetical protein